MRISARNTALLLAPVAAAAAAQEVPRWAQRPPPALPSAMRSTMNAYRWFITCSARRDWSVAAPLFDTPIGSAQQTRILREVSGGSHGNSCSYAYSMRMSDMLMRGGLAEGRYRLVYGGGAVPPAEAAVAPAGDGASFAWVAFGRESPAQVQYDFANCLAAREPGAIHVLLMTEFDTREESAAWQGLSRRFGSCLPPGAQVRANPVTLRPWLAEAQYQAFRARVPDRPD